MNTQLLPFGNEINKKAVRSITLRYMAGPVFLIICAAAILAYEIILMAKGAPLTMSFPLGNAVLACGIIDMIIARATIKDMFDDELVIDRDGTLLFRESDTRLSKRGQTLYRILNVSNIKVYKDRVDIYGEIVKEKYGEDKIFGKLRMLSIPAIYGTPQSIAMAIREYAGTREQNLNNQESG